MKLSRSLRAAGAYIYNRPKSWIVSSSPLVQTAALPWRCTSDGKVEILLITGRTSGNWLVPKGWPMRGKSMAEAAAQEAFEEAGVEGRIEADPIGRFDHVKQHGVLGPVEVSVLLHPLEVERELPEWPEHNERTRRWFAIADAPGAVASPGLGRLIARFAMSVPTV